jgi:5'-nucleotidase
VRILVANDDGIYSPGICALAEVAAEFGDVRVVAPDVEQSSMGHAITASRPLSYRPTKLRSGVEAYRVNGTPADCVALGSYHWEKVDVVLSGVNIGLNLGNSIWHSGTLAAAKQAALLGLRGIALSAPSSGELDYEALKPWIRQVLHALLPDTTLKLVNVNFPRQPRGLVWTRVSVRQYDGRVVPMKDPMGRELYWFTVVPIQGSEPGTDRWAVERNWISLTALRLDLTDEAALAAARTKHPLDEKLVATLPDEPPPDAERTVREDEARAEPVAEPGGRG